MHRLFLLLFRGLAHLPLPILYLFGWLIGWAMTLLPSAMSDRAQHQVDLCFPDLSAARRKQIARRSLRHLAMTHLETLAFWLGPEKRLLRIINNVRIDDALKPFLDSDRQGGVIFLSPHLGSWELAGLTIAAHIPVSFMYKPQKGEIDQIIRDCRSRLGAKLVPSERGGIRDLLKALKNQEAIGILPDQDPPPGSGEFAPLFGIRAHTPILASRLGSRNNTPAVYVYMRREIGRFNYRLRAIPADAAIRSKEMLEATTALNAGVERLIRECPEQYWWAYDRFRRRPKGEPKEESQRITGKQ